jgi:putative phage-type endonuclease
VVVERAITPPEKRRATSADFKEGESMLTQEQIAERVNYIGGSDIAAVLGLSRWSTPLRVWAEKTGQVPPRELDHEAVELGRELEDYVARRFEKKAGKKVHRVNETLFHREHPFLAANIDRRVVGERAILECKVTSAFKAREWEGEEIPQEYILQCLHYLAVTGAERAYIAVLIGNQDFKWKAVERDEKLIRDMVGKAEDFWKDYVVPKVMPSIIKRHDDETLSALFPVASQDMEVELDDRAAAIIELLDAAKADKDALEGQIEQRENELKALLGTAERGMVGPWEVRWKNRRAGGIDTKKFKIDQPDLYAAYTRKGTVRVFEYKKIQQESK